MDLSRPLEPPYKGHGTMEQYKGHGAMEAVYKGHGASEPPYKRKYENGGHGANMGANW